MDFELPEELRLLKETVRTFVDRELIPIEMTSMDGASMRPDVRAALEDKAKKLGLWHLDVPQEYGGQGLEPARPRRGLGGDRPHRSRCRRAARACSGPTCGRSCSL